MRDIQIKKNLENKFHSSTWFRSKDLGVMSPARYTSCAMLLSSYSTFSILIPF